jgi:hypothetical protein
MQSFKSFILEAKKSEAPNGVIFDGSDKVYVGIEHGNPITLSDELVNKIKTIGEEHGYYYEGSGGDRKNVKKYFGMKYKGGWDDGFIKSIKGYPVEYLYTLFTNTNVNKQKENLPKENSTIFDSIINNQKKFSYMKDRQYDEKTLTKFLEICSEHDKDFIKMSKEQATKENTNKFLDAGEKLMWPKNWEEYPNKAGKLAKKVEDARNKYLLDQESGVYFMGSGHLLDIKDMKKSLKIIGGEKI